MPVSRTKTKTTPLAALEPEPAPDFDAMAKDIAPPVAVAVAPVEQRTPGRPKKKDPTQQFTIRITAETLTTLLDMAHEEGRRKGKQVTAQTVVVDAVEKLTRAYRKRQEQNG